MTRGARWLPRTTAPQVAVRGRQLTEARAIVRRTVRRITPMPPLRPFAPPHGPSPRDVYNLWEELDWWSCAYCDCSFGAKVVREIDHVVPLAEGGVHELWNLAPACSECNRGKSNRPAAWWMATLAGQGRA